MPTITLDQYGDPHLGNLQYGSPVRAADFIDSFSRAVDSTVSSGVRHVVIPGDLFHHAAVNPDVFTRTKEILSAAVSGGVRFFALDGNHDAARAGWEHSWVGALAKDRLLFLLRSEFDDGRLVLPSSDGISGGEILAENGVRMFGCQYVGGRTNHLIRSFIDDVDTDPEALNILCLHAGVEGTVPGMAGGIARSLLPKLSEKVDLLLLGHIHMPYEVGGWVFSAGSIEPCNTLEAAWSDREPCGVNRITVTKEDGRVSVSRKSLSFRKRGFARIEIDASPCMSASEIPALLEERMVAIAPDQVIDLTVSGTVMFPREEIDMKELKAMAEKSLSPVAFSRVSNRTLPIDMPSLHDGMTDRVEMERSIMSTLAAGTLRHVGKPEVYADFMAEAMEAALSGGDTLSPVMSMLKEMEDV